MLEGIGCYEQYMSHGTNIFNLLLIERMYCLNRLLLYTSDYKDVLASRIRYCKYSNFVLAVEHGKFVGQKLLAKRYILL